MSKKWLALALKFLVSGFLIWFLAQGIDLDDAYERLTQIDPGMLVAAMLVLLVQICIGGLRWGMTLRAIGAPFSLTKSIQLFYIGTFFSQVLPSSVGGDAVRMFKSYRAGLELRGAINGVILERVITVVALVVLVAGSQPWFLSRVDEGTRQLMVPGIVLIVVGTVVGLVVLMALDRLPEMFRRWRVFRGLGFLGVDARRIFLNPGKLFPVMVLGLLTHLNMSLCVFLLAMGLELSVTWIDCLVLVPPVLMIMTLPISIGGWGVREKAMVTMFGLIGVPSEGAFVLSVLFGLVGMALSIPGGLVWLATRDKGENMDFKTPDLTSETTSEEPEDPIAPSN
ncbi:MAG: lysylphosphatidylglycerol synthase transmembrane domain-containing protein [Rhodospirillales bacterium]